jgi:hypothetical protein
MDQFVDGDGPFFIGIKGFPAISSRSSMASNSIHLIQITQADA